MKRVAAFLIILIFTVSISASFTPVLGSASDGTGEGSEYDIYIEYLAALGVFSGDSSGDLHGERTITREEFAKVILIVSGNEDLYSVYSNTYNFPDVTVSRWSNGYIGAVLSMGYMTGKPDGLFHPTESIDFAQAATVIGRLLGYSGDELTGSWPYNYLTLLKNEGIISGISYSSTSNVKRNVLAAMLHRMLQTNVSGQDMMFCDTTNTYKSIVILENSFTAPDMSANRILTEKGIYYLDDGITVPDTGKIYTAKISSGIISGLSPMYMEYTDISVESTVSGTVKTSTGSTVILPSDATYYYNGSTADLSQILTQLQNSSSIVIAKCQSRTLYAAVFDPVHSSPKVATSGMTSSMLERQYGKKLIERDGKIITASQIEINDVIYNVTDIWGGNGYVLVSGNSISGEVTAILPNKASPASIEIDGESCELGDGFPLQKLNSSGTIERGDSVTLLLGNDGKAVDIILSGTGENGDHVLVLDAYSETSIQSENFGEKLYYVSLLHTNGARKVYLVSTDHSAYKGKLAKYTVIETGDEYDTVSLVSIDNMTSQSYEIKKDEKMLDNSYVTDNVVIFNMIYNVYGRESDASVLKWSDLPRGRLLSGKVKYIHKTGDFMDIDVLYLDNVLDEGIAYGLVTSLSTKSSPTGTQQTLTLLINGEQYTYTGTSTGASVGSVLKIRMQNDSIISTEGTINAVTASSTIDAVDSSRIKLNGTVYSYHRDIAVYKLQQSNTWKAVGTSNIDKGMENGNVRIYLDKPLSYGGKVVMILY